MKRDCSLIACFRVTGKSVIYGEVIMNKIAAVTMVKNEADVIESFARHVLRLADMLYVMDHHSSDETVHILQQLQKEGLPIILDTYEPEEHRQSEVMTHLMRKAMDEGADLVLPLDADEFLLSNRGLTYLRNFLKHLNTDNVYRVQWVDYDLLAPEDDGEVFLLARPYVFKQVNNLGKVLMGKGAVEAHNLLLMQGNHYAQFSDNAGSIRGFYDRQLGSEIQVAHFPHRSKEQKLSKDICMWLSNLARFTKYTYYSRSYGCTYRHFIQQFCMHEDVKSNTKGNQVDTDRQEKSFTDFSSGCDLRYTAGHVSAVANALNLAESLAASYGTVKALFRHPPISVLVWYNGLTDLQTSLESICQQSYAPQQVLLLTPGDTVPSEAVLLTQELRDKYGCFWEFGTIAGDVFSQLPSHVSGEYIQFVLPGDRLLPNKLRDMTALLETHEHTSFATSLNPKEDSSVSNNQMIKSQRNVFFKLDVQILQSILETGKNINTNLSGFLFRRRLMEANSYLCNAFAEGRVLYFNLWSECAVENEMQALIMEPLTESKEQIYQPEDLLLSEIELGYVLQKLRGSRLLPEEKYQLCRMTYLARAQKEIHVFAGAKLWLLASYRALLREL